MNNLIRILIIILSVVMFSSKSFSKWTETFMIGKGEAIHYIDFDRIRKKNGYVYWWSLIDFSKPNKGILSIMGYAQGDCKMYRRKVLSIVTYKKNMGRGTSKTYDGDDKWIYPRPKTAHEDALKRLCNE